MKTKMNIQVKTAILAIVACLARGVWLLAALAALTAPSAAEAALKTLDANNSLLAFWPQFSEETLTSGSYTFSNFRADTLNNGIVTVDSISGFAFSNSTDTATWSGNGTGITIMLNYSDFSVPSGNAVFMTTSLNGLHDSAIGLFSNSSGTTKGFWYNSNNGVGWSPNANTYTETTLLASGAMFFEYDYATANKGGTGVYVYNVASDNTDSEIYHATGLRSNVNVGKIVHIGSSSHGNATWYRNEELKVHSVAIFQKTLTAAERTAFALTRKLEVSADTDFANLTATSFTDLYGNATDWNAGTNLCINVPAAASDTVTLTLPSEGLKAGSLLHIQVAEGKTLVLSGSATAGSIVVTGKGMVSCSAAGTLSGVVKGDGTVVYDLNNGATNPAATFNNAAWTGVLWIKNRAYAGFSINSFGSADSTLRLSNFNCFFSSKETANPTLDLEGEGLTVSNGNSTQVETIKKLTGSGTLTLSGGSADGNGFVVNDASEFYGAIQNTTAAGNARRYKVTIGASGTYGYDRNMVITSGYAATIADGKTWTMPGGFEVSGTLAFSGTGSATGAVTTSTGAMLDFSAYTGETQAISGALTLASGTTIKLPSGTTFPYQIAGSGDATVENVTYQIGDETAVTKTVYVSGGYLCPVRCSAFAGGETAINWSDLVWDIAYSDEAMAFSRVTASASGTLALGEVSTGKVILEVPQGVELTLTGTLAASEIVVTGAGTVVCSAANTLQGTVTGNATVVYSALPADTALFNDSGWEGVVWLKNATIAAFKANLGNANSVIRFTGCSGYPFYGDTTTKVYEIDSTIDLQDDGDTKAFTTSDGYGGYRAIFKALTGSGTFVSNHSSSHYYIFKDATAFAGTIALGSSANTHVVLGNATATDTANGSIYVVSGTIATGKTWTAPGGFAVNGTLAVSGTGAVSGDLSLATGATLDLSAYTGSQAVSGAFAPSANSTLLLPSGATLPYRVAASGDAFFAHFTYRIGDNADVTGPVLFDDGALLADGVKTATLAGVNGVAKNTLFGTGAIEWTGSGNHYVLTLTAANSLLTVGDTTGVESLTIIVQNDGVLYVSGELPENTTIEGLGALTVAENVTADFYAEYTRLYSQIGTATTGDGAISSSGTTISVGSIQSVATTLSAGNYTLARWLTPQKLSTGYGYAANVSIASPATVASGCAYELVYMADRIVLRVYDTAAQNARGTLKIWPYGDSITEGFNSSDTTANYRVLLAQKLSLLGYNVEMVGCYDRVQSQSGTTTFYDAKDPSGQTVPAAWAKHSAKHGGTVGVTSVTSYERSAMVENVDTLAAQAGSPDVVLLHGGINDLSVVSDVNTVFANWTNVVWKLLDDLPNAKIVVSTTLYATYGSAGTLNPRSDAFNALVRAQVAKVEGTDEGAFPAGRVILADLNSIVQSTDDGILSGDKLHPDWWGHDQMAEGWLAAIESIYSANGPDSTFASASGLPAVASSDLGAAAKTELADYRKGFTRYGWFDATGAKDVENITYTDVNSDAADTDISKVAYFVEYVRADNNAHKWVWVDMDAFGTTIADVGLPSATHQQLVRHMHVKSNHNGIEDVAADDEGVSGWIQFSPYDYSGAVSGATGAPTAHGGNDKAMFDWNNLISSEENVDSGTNACMQVFRVSPSSGRPAQTLFAYNNWRSTTLPAEFGIGNFAQHFWGGAQTLDYTYTRGTANNNFTSMNADAYTVKRIEIWTKGASEYITNDKKGTGTDKANISTETWQLTVPGTDGSFVKLDKILLGLRSDDTTQMAKRTVVRLMVSTAQGTVAVSELMNGDGNAQTTTRFVDNAYPQTFEFGEDCVLECGTTYTLTMIDSSGAANAVWPAWMEAYADAASYSPIVNTVNYPDAWRIAQSLYASKVRVATVSADVASFGALAFSPALPSDASEAALLVNVTANAEITLGDAMPLVGSIRFAVAEGATLTIADPANINAGEVVFYGPGTVAFGASPDFGAADVEFAGSPTVVLALGQTIATTGDVVIDKNATVTFEPATITDPTAALVSAASLANNGTLGLTAPDQGSDYSVAATATGVTLRRVTREAFSYDAYPGGSGPTGWFESWGGEQLSTTSLRVGPSAAIPFVYHTSGSAHPWNALAARKSGVSLAVYADVSEMNSSKGVIAQFGNKDSGVFLYRDDNYVKVAKLVKSSITTSKWVPGVEVQSGFHLYTFTYDPATGAAALYLDDGSVSAATDGSADYAHLGTTALNDGFQIGATYQNNPSGFANGADMALCSVRGYDAVLAPQEVATLSESFPATDGTIDRHIVLGDSSNTQTLSVYSSTQKTGVSAILATNGGNIVIPAGEEVSVDRFRTFTDGTSKAANALTVNGTLNIANVDSTPDATCGIVLGWWLSPTDGARTSVVTVPAGGEIDASNAYFVIPYVNNMASATLNVSGGTVKTKGLYAYHPNSNSVLGHITISGGGVLELGEQVTAGKVIEKSFGYGTYRVKGTGEEKGSIAFTSANIAEPTTLDPYGCTLTLSGMSGAGYITVADSSAGDGTVVFPAQGSFTGAIILTDDNADNMNISAYTGKIVLRGTAAETIAKLDDYTGIVIIDQAGTYDATSIDLSGATVQIAHANAVVNATAGKEGNVSVVVGTCNLYTDNNTFLYDGHVFAGGVNSVGATLNYIHSEAYSVSPLSWEIGAAFSAEELAEVKSGNNIAPYFKIFVGHADGDDMAGSLAVATDWNGHTAEDEAPTSGNMAIRVSDGKTLTIDVSSAVSFGEVQVFGSGRVVFTGEAALTVTKGLYVTPGTTVTLDGTSVAFTGDGNPGVHVDYGLTEAASGKVVLADGTAQSPYAPYIYGQGAVEVPAGAVASLANQQNAISYLTVDGTATAAASSTALAALSALTVSATGVLDVPAGATVSPAVLTVNGTMNMASTATLSDVTTLSGAGTVTWNGKNVDLTLWSSQTGWTGTNAVYNLTGNANRAIQSWGRNGSYVLLSGVKGHLDPNIVIQAEVLLDNGTSGYGIEVSDGSGNDNPTYFRKLSGTGTFKQSGTTGNQRFVLRDVSDFTGSIARTDTQRVMIIDGTTTQANLPGRSANAGNMFFANIAAKIGDGNSWSVSSDKSISIAGTATVELLGAASMTGAVTIGGGATLTFDDIGTSETPKKLTLSSTVTVASANTVNIALSAEAAAALYDGAVLIDWTAAGAAPEGSFAFSDSTLADDWVLFKAADGLVVYDKTIDDTSSNPAAVLNVDDSGALVATVTPTGNAITLPAVISKMTVSVSARQLANITASGVAVGDVVVKYGDTVTTGAYSITKSGYVISFDINTAEDASVTIADETIKVRPETAASTPMTMSAGAPSFTMKTIPGLWYRAAVCSSPDGTFAPCGDAVQATSTSTTVNGTAEWGSGEKVRYYRIKAGAASDL